MKKINNIPGKVLRLFVLTALFSISLPSNAHIVGISWKDMGDHTVRFYGETAHEITGGVAGGSLTIGPWATRDLYAWTEVETGSTLAELDVDDMAYWDPDGEGSVIMGTDYYDAHTGGAGGYNNFFYLDIANFVSGEYLLQLEQGCCSPIDRPISYAYLDAFINVNVPEPPVFALFGMGLLAMFMRRKIKKN